MITVAEIKVPVSQCSEGLYLRWCFGGWHYQMFNVGDEIYTTEGAFHNTDSKSQLKIGISGLSYQGMRGLRTMLFATAVEAYFPDGWKPITFENSSTIVEDTTLSTYSCEYTITVYARNGLYSPVKPVIPDDYIVSYTAFPDITTTIGGTVTLPATASVVYFSGRIATVNVTWGNYSTSEAGTFIIVGTIVGSTFTVEQKLIVNELTDLDILRQIRDANPTSQLPTLWLDSEDPYTQWEGVTWNIEHTKLLQLDVFNKQVSSLELINLLYDLNYLDCGRNNLNNINTSNLIKLDYLDCSNNNISSINLSNNLLLTKLYCTDNLLTNLDVSHLSILTELQCFNNKLLLINVLGLNLLTELHCNKNELTSIDVNGLASLSIFNCNENKLTSLNLGGVTTLTYIDFRSNLLEEIQTLTFKGNINFYNFTYNNFPTAELDRFRAMGFIDESKLLPQNP